MTDLSPSDLLTAALEIGADAESIPLRYFRSNVAVEDKPDESPVTIADRETEQAIRRAIEERFPAHGIFGEEFGKTNEASDTTWIIDPIDGTRSFIAGVPLFGMLLGVLRKEDPVAGVIRMPALGEVYAGCRGGTATMNGTPIGCRSRRIEESYVFINEANLMVERHPERLKRLMHVGRDHRFFNDCYAFALLAAGEIDAVVDTGLQPYDYLPVSPVIEAAGGIVTDWGGAPLRLQSDGTLVAAATAELHKELLALLQ